MTDRRIGAMAGAGTRHSGTAPAPRRLSAPCRLPVPCRPLATCRPSWRRRLPLACQPAGWIAIWRRLGRMAVRSCRPLLVPA